MVEFETRNAPPGGGNSRLCELAELTAVDEGLQDILLEPLCRDIKGVSTAPCASDMSSTVTAYGRPDLR
jgi:hypothetical protein